MSQSPRLLATALASASLLAVTTTALHAVETTASTASRNTASQPNGAPLVAEIIISGTGDTHADRIRFRLKSRVGHGFNTVDVADDVRMINTMGGFYNGTSSVEFIDDHSVRLIFSMEALPLIREVYLNGPGYWDSQGYKKVIISKAGGYANDVIVESDRRALVDHYKAKGFMRVSVTSRIEKASSSRSVNNTDIADIHFDVDLGEVVKIATLEFEGLPEGAYKQRLRSLPGLANQPGQSFMKEQVTTDANAIAQFLAGLGYLDARVTKSVPRFYDTVRGPERRRRAGPWLAPDGKHKDRVLITYHIDAGHRYKLGSVHFTGNTIVSEVDLRTAFAMNDGDWYTRKELFAGRNATRLLIRNKGYATAYYTVSASYDFEKRLVHETIHFVEGDTYSFGRVDIRGNTITKDIALRRLLPVYPGTQYTEDGVTESERQINRIGLFRTEAFQRPRVLKLFDPQRPNEVDIDVVVTEKPTGRLGAQLGYVTDSGIVGQIEYSEDNFDLWGFLTTGTLRGAAQTLSTTVRWSDETSSASLYWRNPHVFDSSYFFSSRFTYSNSSVDGRDYEEDRFSTTFTFGRHFLNNDLLLSVGWRYDTLDIKEKQEQAADDVEEGTYTNHTALLRQRYDLRNNSRMPTQGFMLEATESVTGGPLPASNDYAELYLKGNIFMPVTESDMGGVSFLQFRQLYRRLTTLESGDSVPFYDRYLGGGPFPSHRGFRRNRLGPEEQNKNGYTTQPGGTTELLSTLQYSVPLQGTNLGIRGVLFLDHGFLWGQNEDVDFGDMRTAVGFGIRMPPSLPISLDFAYLLDKHGSIEGHEIQFSLGGMQF